MNKLLKQILEDNNISYKENDDLIIVGDLRIKFLEDIIRTNNGNCLVGEHIKVTNGRIPIFKYEYHTPNLEKLAKVLPYLKDLKSSLQTHETHPDYEKFKERIQSVVEEYDPEARITESKDFIKVTARNTELLLIFDLGHVENWEALDAILGLL